MNPLLLVIFTSITAFVYKTKTSVERIEEIFELDIPNCYTELPNPSEKFDFHPHTVIELKFETACCMTMYEDQMLPFKGTCGNYYVGTTIWSDPAWHNEKKKAFMYLDLDSCILHFEDYN